METSGASRVDGYDGQRAVRGVALVVAALGVLVGLSTLLPWVRAGIHGVHVYRGVSLLVLVIPVLVGTAVIVLTAVHGALSGKPTALSLAGVVSALLAAFAGIQIFLVETLNAIIPRALLPSVVRRLTFGVSAQVGLWLAFALAVVTCVVAFKPQSVSASFGSLLLAGRDTGVSAGSSLVAAFSSVRVIGTAAPLAIAAALITLRYDPWVFAKADGHSWALPGWALPWVGLWSVLVVFSLVGAALLTGANLVHVGALVTAGSGWLLTFFAGIVIATVGDLGRADLNALAPEAVRRYTPTVHASGSVWGVFVLGILAAAVAATTLVRSARGRGESATTAETYDPQNWGAISTQP